MAWLRPKKFPTYFDYFIDSYSRNTKTSLKIFTNVACSPYIKKYQDSSIGFHQFSLKKMFNLFKDKLAISGYDYDQYRAYKMCDFRPAFGEIFSEYLEGFDYWGYIDIDVIVGNLDRFLTAEKLADYDVISGGRNNLTGYMTLYRNTEAINSLYKKSPDYLRVINSPQNFRFDENGGKRNIIAMEQLIRNNNIPIRYLNCVHNDFGKINSSIDNNSREWIYDYNDGMLIDRLTKEEIAMFHFMQGKASQNFTFQKFRHSSSFSISPQGLHYS
ncbi:MAG: DUF6625 family protein [Microcoleaceae cyanobacterium]